MKGNKAVVLNMYDARTNQKKKSRNTCMGKGLKTHIHIAILLPFTYLHSRTQANNHNPTFFYLWILVRAGVIGEVKRTNMIFIHGNII